MNRSSTFLSLSVLLVATTVYACGPEGSMARSGSKGRGRLAGSGSGFLPGQQMANPQLFAGAMMQMQMNRQRQLLAMQASARRARMKPQRIARYQQQREQIAARRKRTYEMLAAQQRERLERQRQPSTTSDAGRVLLASNPAGFSR